MSEHDEQDTGPGDDSAQTEDQQAQMERMVRNLHKMESTNRDTMQQLQLRNAQPSPLNMTQLRLEILITVILGNYDQPGRIQFETIWQQQLAEMLSEQYQKKAGKKIHVPGRG